MEKQGLSIRENTSKILRMLVNGCELSTIATATGYTYDAVHHLVRRPEFAAEVAAKITVLLRTEDAPLARLTLRRIMLDEKASPSVRVECAKALLNRAGFGEPKAAPAVDTSHKSPSEMSGDELRAMIDKLQGEIGARASGAAVIDGACEPIASQDPAQVVDILG